MRLRLKTPWKTGPACRAEGSVLVVATRLTWRRLRDIPEVIVSGLRLRAAWGEMPGAVGVQTGADLLQNTMVSVSVWDSERAFSSFMAHPKHAELMNRHRARLAHSYSARWWTDEFDLGAAWVEGDRRLAARSDLPR